MNRANFGNVVTNGMQILSVGATTAGGFIARANKALNQEGTSVKSSKPEYTSVDEIMQDSPQKQDIIVNRNQKIDWKLNMMKIYQKYKILYNLYMKNLNKNKWKRRN